MADATAGQEKGIVCRADQLEEEWCERDIKNKPIFETVPIMNVGVHPGNRGGVYTQGKACRTLLEIL